MPRAALRVVLAATGAFAIQTAPASAMVKSMTALASEIVDLHSEQTCLAEAIYFEARSEPEAGQAAVGRVILNRVDSPYYPDTVCDVVYQNAEKFNACQFSFACDGTEPQIKESDAYARAMVVAAQLVACDRDCRVTTGTKGGIATSTHYHADYVSPWWSSKLKRLGHVGRHIFYYTATR